MAQSTRNPEYGEEKGGSAPPCTHGRGVCSLGAGCACAQLRVPARFLPVAAPRGCLHPPPCPDGAGATWCSQQAPARGEESSTSMPGSAGALSHPKTSSSPPRAPVAPQLRGTALAPAALDAQRELDGGRGARLPPAPLRALATDTSTGPAMPVGCRWDAVVGLGASLPPAAPRPRCSARGTLRRGPLFCRAGLRGRIPLSELNNILF